MQCKNCSGNEFKQTKSGNFKCSYCSTLYYDEAESSLIISLRRWKKLIIPSVLLLVILVLIFLPRTKDNTKTENYSDSNTFTSIEKLPDPSAEIISVTPIADSIGNIYFLAICRNTGKVAINRPDITIRLSTSDNKKVASGKGYAFKDRLNPGEISPVYILITNCPVYNKIETDYTPELPYIIPKGGVFEKNFSGDFTDVSMTQENSYNNFKIRGKIKNTSAYDAEYVQVAAIIFDKNNKAIGYGSTYINEKKLKPGNFDFFEIFLSTVTEKPEYYKLYFDGNVD